MENFFKKHSNSFYVVFRVIIGLVFFLHGYQKLQGVIGGNIELVSLFGLAMVIEVLGGALILIGLLTRYVALITAVEMLIAYFMVHITKGLSPLANGGEPAVLFFAAFLVLIAYGAGKFSVDSILKK
ncbi:MAG: DoxX family protein [Nanoarchaeota archaeon]